MSADLADERATKIDIYDAGIKLAARAIAAEAAIARVRALHGQCGCGCEACATCDTLTYPCATLRALDGETTA